jgi:hypothetical protein
MAGASRFLTGLLSRFAAHASIPRRRQPAAKQTSVTLLLVTCACYPFSTR